MSFSRSVESQDNALTDASPVKSNARALATGSWWRFSRYEIRDGYIRPALGARLRRYDPWKRWLKTRAVSRRSDGSVRGATPYRELLELLNKLEYRSVGADSPEFTPAQVDMLAGPLTADSEQRILRWCARYGLLGILQHRLLQVVLSPRNDAQVEYRRISLGWAAVERVRENPFTPILEPALTLAVPGTPNLLPVFTPPLVETGHVAQADAAEDGRCDFAAAAAPPPESSVTGFGAGDAPTNGSESDR